jgi:gliding motility-associated lipoprotein GldH
MGWHKNDTLLFSLDSAIIHHTYQLQLGIRHKDSYPYRDLWLTINQDTVHLYLADTIGYWKGNGIGDMRQSTHLIAISSQDSIQEIQIKHIMQDNPLTGIHDIGIQIKEYP